MQTKSKSFLIILVGILLAFIGGYIATQSSNVGSTFVAQAVAKEGHSAKDLQKLIDCTPSNGTLKLTTFYGDSANQTFENGAHTLLATVVNITKPITIDLMGYSLLAICLNINVEENQKVEICDSLSSGAINLNRGASLNGVYPCSINARKGKVTLTNITVYDSPATGQNANIALGLYVSGADVTLNGGKYINNFAGTTINGLCAESIFFSAGALTINHAQSIVDPNINMYGQSVYNGSALSIAKTKGLIINAGSFESKTSNSALYYSSNITDETVISTFMGNEYNSTIKTLSDNGKILDITCNIMALNSSVKASGTSDNVYYAYDKAKLKSEYVLNVPLIGLSSSAQYNWIYKSALEDIDYTIVSSGKYQILPYLLENNYGVYICDIVDGDNTYRFVNVLSINNDFGWKGIYNSLFIVFSILLLVFFISFLFVSLHTAYNIQFIEDNKEIARLKFERKQRIILPRSLAMQKWYFDKECTKEFKNKVTYMKASDLKLFCKPGIEKTPNILYPVYYANVDEESAVDLIEQAKLKKATKDKKVVKKAEGTTSKKSTNDKKKQSKSKSSAKSSQKSQSKNSNQTTKQSNKKQNTKKVQKSKPQVQENKQVENASKKRTKQAKVKKELIKYQVPEDQKIAKKRAMKKKVVRK